MDEHQSTLDRLELAADIVAAYVSNNPAPATELSNLIVEVHKTLNGLGAAPSKEPAEPRMPAVPIRKSITPDHLFCLEDGKKFKSLKRHLATHHGMTSDEYRAKWNLPHDYPMVAPSYAAARSALAKKTGLGLKRAELPAQAATPAKRGRKPKTE